MGVPNHVAIILDGNGRWAAQRKMPRNYGHTQGARNLEEICRAAWDFGIKYLTVYAFSTENWNRPRDEVDALMRLLRDYLKNCIKTAEKNHMRVRVIGDKTGLDEDIQESIQKLEEFSKDQDGLNLQIAINYGSRDEMLRGMRRMLSDYKSGKFSLEDLNEGFFESYLDTCGIPAPDLLIRTSGEQRLSNFLLWQVAYCELYFTPAYWPDFTKEELGRAIEEYGRRDRRFGGVKEG